MTPARRERLLAWLDSLSRHSDLLVVVGLAIVVLAVIAPLPTALMDVLLTLNLTSAALIILTSLYVVRPLDFSVFPSILLITTFFRLALNIATTRLILSNAREMGDLAAGHVVKTFGEFVAGANPFIGFIIFLMLVIIQFVVITKGATRISEVAARFTLDGMPGKQMAIDADLNAGLITEAEARERRSLITREADFYGAMDGATKFVRGDAIAGILITIVNIVGGLIIGTLMYGLGLAESARIFTTLTVGDGLVSQLPALLISIAAGLVVARSTGKSDLPRELLEQTLLAKPRVLVFAACFLLVLIVTPLPKLPLLGIAAGLGGIAWVLTWSEREREGERQRAKAKEPQKKPERVEPLLKVDPMEIEIGYGLIRLVDQAQGGDLLDRISVIRRQLALEMGLVVPPIRIRDNVQLEPNQYVVKVKAVPVARGEALADHFLAMDAGVATGKIEGVKTREPAFGLEAYWIQAQERQRAEALGYTVVEPSSVVATHLTELIKQHAAELLTREEVTNLLETLKKSSPKLVSELVPDVVKVGDVQKVLQNLLRERVSIRDLETIVEVLGDYAPRTKDAEILTEYARNALARTITEQARAEDGKLYCVTLDPRLEEMVAKSTEHTDRGSYLTLSPREVQAIGRRISEALERLVAKGRSPVVLTSPQARLQVKRLIEAHVPGTTVISYNEVAKGTPVESVGMATLGSTEMAGAGAAAAGRAG